MVDNQSNGQSSTPQTDENGDQFITVGKYQVKVIRNTCIAAASCIAISPNVFELDDAQKAIVKEGADDVPENILMAAQSCPTKAIVIIDTETGQQVWPEG
jgi:ferredoxin